MHILVPEKHCVMQKLWARSSCSQGLKKCPALFQNTKYKGTKQKTLENYQNRLIQENSAFLK